MGVWVLIWTLFSVSFGWAEPPKIVLLTNSDEVEIEYRCGEDIYRLGPGERRLEFVENEGPVRLVAAYTGNEDVFLTFCGLNDKGDLMLASFPDSLSLTGESGPSLTSRYPGNVMAVIVTVYPVVRESLDPRFYREFGSLSTPTDTGEDSLTNSFNRAVLVAARKYGALLQSRASQFNQFKTLLNQDFLLAQLLLTAAQMEPPLARLQRAQENLPDQTGVLLFNRELPGRLDIFLVTTEVHHTDIVIWDSEVTELIHRLVQSLPARTAVRRFSLANTQLPEAQFDQAALNELSELLLPPEFQDQLADCRYLLIVPCDDIGRVPFGCLTDPVSKKPLIDRVAVSISPSLADVMAAEERTAPDFTFQNPLIVGDPTVPDSSFSRLPGAKYEATEVAKLFQSTAMTDKEATRERVETASADADLIHIAAHGQADPKDFKNSFLALAGTDDNFQWKAEDIRFLRLKAKLAVLSACQTGLGQTHEGGLLGLFRAFQVAGVPDVVVSLWNVDDRSTAYFMVHFYDYLRSHDPAEAVRLASLDTREKYPSPENWACFAHFGVPIRGKGAAE